MSAKVLKDPAASIRQRLFNHAKLNRLDYQRVLTRYAIERLLFRLSQTEGGKRYVLKGAMLFATWPQHMFRPSGDVDLLGEGNPSPEAIGELFTSVCLVECPLDGITFDPATLKVEPVREDEKYRGVRLSLQAGLAGAKIAVQVDVGFGDHVYPAPIRRDFPSLLEELPVANLLMYPVETVIAEKFEAMIRFGTANSRIKDFYDMWIAVRTFQFSLPDVVEAIDGTLRRRETAPPMEMPVGLTQEFYRGVEANGLWSGFLRRTPPAQDPPPFETLQEELRQFFGPVIVALAEPEGAKGQWDPIGFRWG